MKIMLNNSLNTTIGVALSVNIRANNKFSTSATHSPTINLPVLVLSILNLGVHRYERSREKRPYNRFYMCNRSM